MQGQSVILEGCKAISVVLGKAWGIEVSTFRAWRYIRAAVDPCPSWYVRGRVYANQEAVLAWAEKQHLYRRHP